MENNKTRSYTAWIFSLACCWLLFSAPKLSATAQAEQKGWVPDYSHWERWQQPDEILETIGIKRGMTVADVGAGIGNLTLRLARRVGKKGRVYATDIRQDRLEILERRARRAKFKNIITVHATEKESGLPRGACDIIILVHVIHIVIREQDPLALLADLKLALKPGGILVLVHWDGVKMGYPEVEAYSRESVLKVVKEAGFNLIRMETSLPRDTIFILQANTR